MNQKLVIGLVVILAVAGIAGAYYMYVSGEEQSGENGGGHGGSGTNDTQIREYIYSLPYQNLSADEIQGLQYMREEEKLAHDVYIYAYNKYGTNIFKNIASSESTHTYMVSVLLDKYNLSDPAKDEPEGVFKNATIQKLYWQLVAKVNESEKSALIVGANIEELDIVDIQHWMNKTDNQDIKYVYTQLINGSGNHLRAFVSTLSKMYNYTYKPVYLSQEEYDRIISGQNP